MSDAAATVARLAESHHVATDRHVVVGITGAVAVGKSRFADAVADALRTGPHSLRAAVVTTDGFLFPNHVLVHRGILMRKGFPESYDVEHLRAFVAAVREGGQPVRVPVYSHEIYDVLPNAAHEIEPGEVTIVEGVNALSALEGLLDVGVYLDAAVDDIESWFVARFLALREEARDDPRSFYRGFAEMSEADADAAARNVWREVNLVNLLECIQPSRDRADCVVVKARDHSVESVTVRTSEGEQRAD